MKKVTVIGCGIIGLTTAIKLEQAGYEVRIVTKNLHFKTTSAVAAAIWMPFKADPVELVNQWSLESYEVFKNQSQDPITGVSMVDFNYLSQEDKTPDWANTLPPNSLRKASTTELPPSYKYGYIAHVPLIETPIYLDYLFDEFRGEIIIDEILNFEELDIPDSVIINCTGLESRVLANDTSVYPIKGQVIKVAASGDIICAADEHPDHFFYIIPRRDCIVLGGSAIAHDYSSHVDDKITQTIFERVQKIEPKILTSQSLKVETGLRPYRPTIRLEKESGRNIIHNYGHGGCGFTVSWGCANSVLELVKTI
jgi:D-amino-acid oxidase